MSFTDAIKTCFRKYVTFSGRATRPEYWYFILFVFLGSIVTSILDAGLFGSAAIETSPGMVEYRSNGPLATIFGLGTLLPSISAGWRRMHDTGKSGLFLLYPMIVMIGMGSFAGLMGLGGDIGSAPLTGITAIVLGLSVVVFLISPFLVLWWLTRPSQPVSNPYGPNPHEVPQ